MWEYSQSKGSMSFGTGGLLAIGYSGAPGVGKNNPAQESVENVGPIPQGLYRIQAPVDTVTHGPYVLPLTPDPANEMFGRAGFLCHGDSVVDPGTASKGCIILPRFARQRIWESNDHVLTVVA